MRDKVLVYGLWHLGTVTAACLAEHFTTVACDPDARRVSELQTGRLPVDEPGLAELVQEGLSAGKLSFSGKLESAIQGAELVWVTFDTPVRDDDTADVGSVLHEVKTLFPYLEDGMLVVVSSQVPTGFTADVEKAFRAAYPDRDVSFAYSPENLRLGSALDAFRRPDRVVVGVRREQDRSRLASLLAPFCKRVEWMSVESAEMTKHALNAYLATSVVFINELAALCEPVGADAKEVERGLRGDPRIGPKAYLSPGGAFSGGTLARDIAYLAQMGRQSNAPTHLWDGVRASNDDHMDWPRRKLKQVLGDLSGRTVAVLGLTYKPGTDTLRRSGAVELCVWLAQNGANVQAYDPAITQLPSDLRTHIRLCATAQDALEQADALVVATGWPEFKEVSAPDVIENMCSPIVVDAERLLAGNLGSDPTVRYFAVGLPAKAL